MSETTATDAPESPETVPPAPPPELARLKKRALWGLGILFVLYFNIYLFPMVFHTVFPFFFLGAIGFVLGVALPGKTKGATWSVFALVLAATLFRRLSTLNVSLANEIFGGALASGGYPPWAAWLAEIVRLRIYLGALQLGTYLGAQLRTLPDDNAEGAAEP